MLWLMFWGRLNKRRGSIKRTLLMVSFFACVTVNVYCNQVYSCKTKWIYHSTMLHSVLPGINSKKKWDLLFSSEVWYSIAMLFLMLFINCNQLFANSLCFFNTFQTLIICFEILTSEKYIFLPNYRLKGQKFYPVFIVLVLIDSGL